MIVRTDARHDSGKSSPIIFKLGERLQDAHYLGSNEVARHTGIKNTLHSSDLIPSQLQPSVMISLTVEILQHHGCEDVLGMPD